METFATLGDMLLRRYAVDMIAQMQQLSSPIHSQLKENSRFAATGAGVYFAVRVDGNESGGGWRQTDDQVLPSAGNERIKQAVVNPRKYYHMVTFSGLAEAVSRRGGEDAFAAGITDAISAAVKRAGANFETTFLNGDGTGRLTNVNGAQTSVTTVTVDDARSFRSGQVVIFLNNTTGAVSAGPVVVNSRSVANTTITVASSVTVADNDGVYIAGEQPTGVAPVQVTALGLPALVNNTGSIYGLSRTTYPVLQSKVIAAGSTSLDESMLRRLRTQVSVETAVETLDGWAIISSHDQFNRYTEIALPFRRFNDLTLELGARQELTSFEGHKWLISWAVDPTVLYFLNLGAIERGVVRPLSVDPRVNMVWIPGQDAFSVLLKAYTENVGRYLNQSSKITGLTAPTY